MEWDKKIEGLLEKYFEGTTTVAEEKTLKQYFSSDTVAPHLEHYRSMFGYYTAVRQETMDKELVLTPAKRFNYSWLAAASVAVLMGLAVYTYQNQSDVQHGVAQTDLGTYDSPEEAFKETQKALAMVSGHLNTGVESMGYLSEYEHSKNQIFKQ